MKLRLLILALGAAALAAAQKYDGPRPPKADLPYIKHASSLVPTEASEAKEEKGKKDETTYAIPGAASTARTPLASPIFILQAQKLNAQSLLLYRLETRNGRREITASPKKPMQPIRMEVSRLDSSGLYKLEVVDSLEPGEYSLSPEGSNLVFCFQVF
ncbi:MAG TPA: hypothetical protein VMH28_03505 [Candidatus Acidoferrales bacterium]|nr:hypothetical protein [Candidatus Acidoferrales bacterium]